MLDPNDSIERQNEKLRRIVQSLMDRVERNTDQTGNAFGLFQRAIALEGEVKARTRDLQRTLDQLSRANQEREAASSVADEANRAKSRFVAAASHDVGQPLNAAKLFLATLADTPLDEAQHGIIDQVASALNSVENLIGSLLEISRLDSSSLHVEPASFPAWSVLGPLIDEMTPMATGFGVRIRAVPSGHWVESDPYYLRQIVQNVLANAIQYSAEGGRVLVGCRRRGDELEIQVTDTGPGIAAADIPVIFEEFKRLRRDNRRQRSDDGVGLGLAIVKRACDLLGHSYRMESELGRGTSFAFSIPIRRPVVGAVAAADTTAVESAETLVVLLLSADADLLGQIASLLDQWGAGAVFATSLDDATATIEQLGMYPDAVLIDAATAANEDARRVAEFLSLATIPAVIAPAGPAPTAARAWPETLPRLARPIQPHRLRAILHRGRTPLV